MPARVADASVLAAMAFREPREEEAEALVADDLLLEPAILPFELVSIARKKAMAYPERLDDLMQSLQVALGMNMRFVAVDFAAVLRLSLETGLTTYDASYMYVSRAQGVPLVTFDNKLSRVAGEARGHGEGSN